MKYLEFTAFMLCIQLSLAILNASGLLSTEMPYQDSRFTEIQDNAVKNQQYDTKNLVTEILQAGIDFVKAIAIFVYIAAKGIVSLPYLLQTFGVTYPFYYFFSVPIYMMYSIALLQFLANRPKV